MVEETERTMYPDLDMSFINMGIHLFSFQEIVLN